MGQSTPVDQDAGSFSPFCRLPDELVLVLLSHMDQADLFQCSKLSRRLNRLAVQRVLDDHMIWNPMECCALVLERNTIFDVLSALLISVHHNNSKLGYLYVDLSHIRAYSNLLPYVTRLARLMSKAQSVGCVALYFNQNLGYAQIFSPSKYKEFCKAFEELLNLIVAKSCTRFQFRGSTGLLVLQAQLYHQLKKATPSPSLIASVKRHRKGRKLESNDPVTQEELRYSRRATIQGPHVAINYAAPSPLPSRLVHLEAGTMDIFRPPFSRWTFTMLRSSPIKILSMSCHNLPDDEAESQFILDRVAAAVPQLTHLGIDSLGIGMVQDLLAWLNKFPLLDTLTVGAVEFRGDFHPQHLQLDLPNLERLEARPQLLSRILSDLPDHVRLPKLKAIGVRDGLMFNVEKLAEAVIKSRQVLRARTTSSSNRDDVCLKVSLDFDPLRFADFGDTIAPPLLSTIPPAPVSPELLDGLAKVPVLEVKLPGTREDIQGGCFNHEIFACASLFPGLKTVVLTSNEYVVKQTAEALDPAQLARIKSRCPFICDARVF